ncbi:nodulation protein NfeD [Sulfurimonas sp. HSL-1656]|uniref:NfeD family protein n=1 Tax=Thiomicrolovo subterrani TaxID=3131934 RepID=UPI0031F83768
MLFSVLLYTLLSAVPVSLLEISGAIGPASSSYLEKGLAAAQRQQAAIVLVELDTPGGLLTSTREMVQAILGSAVPVVVYVAPKGAHAASAGTFLVYAAHIAAMAPGTNLGAATPIGLMPGQKETGESAVPLRKALNDTRAYIKSLAELRDRNASWGERAVENAESLSAGAALQMGVIDILATDRDDLLRQLDGRRVDMEGQMVVLQTANAQLVPYEADWKTRFLAVITDPNIALVLLMLALYGIFFELLNPGGIFPGVIGVIAGVLALYALNLLPFNYAGLLLILLGIALMIAEMFVSGFGILGIGGAAAFAFGALLLFDAETLGTDISIPLIIAVTAVTLLFVMLVVRMLLTSRGRRVVTGREEMVGMDAEVLETTRGGYWVRCHGERWYAESDGPLDVGAHATVTAVSGLTLHLNPPKEKP